MKTLQILERFQVLFNFSQFSNSQKNPLKFHDFQFSVNFESVDFDYLNQFGSNLGVPEDDTRNSVLLKFDPLLKKPVQVTAQNPALNQQKLPITKEEDDFEGLTLKILDPVEFQEQEIKQEFLSHNNSLDSIEGGKHFDSFDNVKMKDFIVPEKNESNHFDCEDVKLRCVFFICSFHCQGHFSFYGFTFFILFQYHF